MDFYNTAKIAAGYGQQQYITPCERLLFDIYIKPGMAILDAGVGGGRTSEYLARNASRYVGIDYAPAMVEVCRQRFPQWEYAVGSVTDLSFFQNGLFDAVVMSYNMLDDVIPDENRWRCLKECCRVLKNGGFLIFSSHNPRAVIVRPRWQAAKARAAAIQAAAPGGVLSREIAWILKMKHYAGEVFSALKSSARSVMRYAVQSAFWRGEGYMLDSHELLTHFWIPARVISELSQFGFRFVRMQGDDYPQKSCFLITDWYYYVFSKNADIARNNHCVFR